MSSHTARGLDAIPMTIPLPVQDGASPVVGYLSQSFSGDVFEHRVFGSDPRGLCSLCGQCKAHSEADGRWYCDRDIEPTSAPATLPLGRCSA